MNRYKGELQDAMWAQEGANDAREGSTRRSKDDPKRWVKESNRIAYKEAYERTCVLLLITRGEK